MIEQKQSMKSVLAPRYGSPDVLTLQEIPMPLPGPEQVRVRVHAASMNAADWHLLRASPFLVRLAMGLLKPNPKKFRGPGGDMSGVVDHLGPNTSKFKVGDAVIAELFNAGFGGCAEYVVVDEKELVAKPINMSFQEAAGLPLAGSTALKAVKEMGQVKSGDAVLINGASGGVGLYALQIAHALGAQVTAVCSKSKEALVQSLSANRVIDYATTNFTEEIERYDLILGINGYHPIKTYRECLKPGGRYVMVGGTGRQMTEAIFLGPFLGKDGKTLRALNTKPDTHRLESLAAMAADGKIKTVIDTVFPLEKTTDAMHLLEEGHTAGKIIVTPSLQSAEEP